MNMGSGIQFNGDGPIMSGTWFNPQTGHKFTVRDCFFEDGNFIVMATNGQRYDYNTIQNYIQCNDADGKAIEPDESVMAPQAQRTKDSLPPEVANILATDTENDPYADLMIPEDKEIVENPLTKGLAKPGLGNLNDTRHIASASEHQTPAAQTPAAQTPAYTTGYLQVADDFAGSAEDIKMIDRVLRRHPAPEFDAVLNWACPEKQIETLVDVLGIDPALIADYYVHKLNQAEIFEGIKAKLTEYITNQWGGATTSATTITVSADSIPAEPVAKRPSRPKGGVRKEPAGTKKRMK